MEGKRILLGVTGSIAAYKAAEVARLMLQRGAKVQVAMTDAACRFVQPLTFEALTRRPVLRDLFASGVEIEHVERAHDADAIVVAPATANAIARYAAGLADDLLSSVVLATRAPVLLAPAMETGMWQNPVTQENLQKLLRRGMRTVGPAEGELASGRSGEGRLAEPATIVEAAGGLFAPADLSGARVLVTAGPTVEKLDPVRVLTNRSTGSMGIAIAEHAARRSARVTLLLGPSPLSPSPVAGPGSLNTIRVESANDMLVAGLSQIEAEDVLIAAAAVSDFRPAQARASKLKRTDPAAHQMELVENPDVLATLARSRRGAGERRLIVMGFAAETEPLFLEENARDKLTRKGCDLVVGNLVSEESGFGPVATEVIVVRRGSPVARFGPASKARVADFILDQLVPLWRQGAT
jgi:phosphopantothenoylcysteine decarboxylase/phosphopantothenate--cysteine ligase